MPIEQSIYTCVRKRRDTQTVGFGYYSFTAGFSELAESCPEIKRASMSYAAPRNQELWWSSASDASSRDREETEKIAAHHPVSFTYFPKEADGNTLAVFSYGRNLGRDIEKARPGNVLINLIAADSTVVTDYPCNYYDSPEIFLPYDTNYFYIHGEEIPPLLPNPEHLSVGSCISENKIIEFIADDRFEHLCAMLQFLLDYHDPAQPTRQIILCDKKDAVINWIRALSIILPKELAKLFSFSTYSFLAQRADDFRPDYENVMLCGVYSPALNADPAESRTTNYQFETEVEREDAAVFDFEHHSFADVGLRSNRFEILLETAFSGDMHLLREYHEFLIQNTTYRSLDNDYLSGYSFFQLHQYPEPENTDCLAEAYAFSQKYTDGTAFAAIIDQLIIALEEQECAVSQYSDVLMYAAVIYANAPNEKKQKVCDICFHKAKSLLVSNEPQKDDYIRLRKCIQDYCKSVQFSYDERLEAVLTDDELRAAGETTKKTWVLAECADILINRILYTNITPEETYSETGHISVFRNLLCKILSVSKKSSEYLEAFISAFDSLPVKISLLDALYTEADAIGKLEIESQAVKMLTSQQQDEAISAMRTLADKPALCDPSVHRFFKTLCEDESIGFAEIQRHMEILFSSDSRCAAAYGKESFECLREKMVLSESPEQAMDNIFAVHNFTDAIEMQDSDAAETLYQAYLELVYEKTNWYDLDAERFKQLKILRNAMLALKGTDSNKSKYNNLRWMRLINFCAKHPDRIDLLPSIQNPFAFDDENAVIHHRIIEKRIIDCFYRCSLEIETVRFDYWQIFEPRDSLFRRQSCDIYTLIMMEWLCQIAENAPKKKRLVMAAEQLAIMSLYSEPDLNRIVSVFRKNGIRYNELSEQMNNLEFKDSIRKFTQEELVDRRITETLTRMRNIYEKEKENSFLGKLWGKRSNES